MVIARRRSSVRWALQTARQVATLKDFQPWFRRFRRPVSKNVGIGEIAAESGIASSCGTLKG
jgi:hypothetical protein